MAWRHWYYPPASVAGLVLGCTLWASTAGANAPPSANLASPARPIPTAAMLNPKRADFLGKLPSPDARQVADWVMSSGDNATLPFVIVDKIGARVFVFDGTGHLRGSSMALLGLAHGDDSIPGIGTRKLALIRPEERTTPAGRFVAMLGRDIHQDILWVDYETAISLHRVVMGNPGDHRHQRLLGNSPLNKRISYGCINVPAKFFDTVVLKVFSGTNGIVYILPEQRRLRDVFPIPAPAPDEKHR